MSTPVATPVPPQTPEQVQQSIVQIQNLPVLYFNHSRLVTSNFDIRIYFGQGNITAQGQQSLTEQLCVILTPEFAATFFDTLKITLEKFQERFGKIRPPAAGSVFSGSSEQPMAKLVKKKKR